MQISLSKFLGVVTGIIGVGMFLYFGYFCYDLFFTGDSTSDTVSVETLNISVLGPKMQKAGAVLVNKTDKIMLKKKDIAFTEGDLFKSFTEIPKGVQMTDSRGRADPFVPYVAPPYVAP
jgi:hypothetical protein